MRRLLCTPLVLAIVAGCHTPTGSPTSPTGFAPGDTQPFSSALTSVGEYAIQIDLEQLTGTATPVPRRAGSQSEVYNLSINRFLTWDTFRILKISRSDDALLLTYGIRHPFAAATNLAGQPTAKNREDLAISGRVLWLAGNPDDDTYFAGDGDVRVNTRIVRNPDGYFTPGALIPSPGTTSNTFPYQLIVDEAKNNRAGRSNGGSAFGNYGAAGWQVAEFTAGITGYDVLAQGQTAVNVLQIAQSELGGGNVFEINAAVIAKYEDPRGGANAVIKRANRLPSDDVLKFGFRMPHGALDVGRLTAYAPNPMAELTFGSFDLAVHVRDWDARATEAAQTNLATETNPKLVSADEAGLPTLDFDIPGMTGLAGTSLAIFDDDTSVGGDAAVDSGAALDELFYVATGSGTPPAVSSLTGLIRATDVVDIATPADWLANRIDLTPDLMSLGTGHEGSTYQSFTIEVLADDLGGFARADVVGGAGASFNSDITLDALGNLYITGAFSGTVDFDPGAGMQERTSAGNQDGFVVSYNSSGGFRWVSVFETDDEMVSGSISIDAARNTYSTGYFYGTVDFDPGAPVVERTSEGDTDLYVVSLDSDGDFRWIATCGGVDTDDGSSIVADTLGNSYTTGSFNETVDFNPGAGIVNRTSAGLYDAYVLALAPDGSFRWVATCGGPLFDSGYGIAMDAHSNLYISGGFQALADLQPGTGITNHLSAGESDGFLLSLTTAGTYRFSRSWGGPLSEEGWGVAVSPGGASVITGYFQGICDFAPGPQVANRTGNGSDDCYVLALSATGDFRWVAPIIGPGQDAAVAIALDAAGQTYLAGAFEAGTDFDPGPGVVTRPNGGADDGFVLCLNPEGGLRWAGTFGGPGVDGPVGIALTETGASYSVGIFESTADFDPGPGVENRTSPGDTSGFVLKLEP